MSDSQRIKVTHPYFFASQDWQPKTQVRHKLSGS